MAISLRSGCPCLLSTAACAPCCSNACDFDWSLISPAIFGALFQSVMDKKKRRAIGAHYTSEQNIMKVIGPLFLDDLKAELARLKARKDTSREKALARVSGKARRA